ncbi:MAG: LysR family transcriptional regulator [Alphaproteobacteria bacterium]|nr:LysR family transcriptional regulator [Alphaproteobacteria bacterium]MCS5597739.1 LysR family transcriptional regulator [Alphaproteobacteria bacterium]|tara:strand:+ start:1492 stop:2361 length:870 start_codon:yes stop_codon:yes gene_type:complete
MPFHTDTLTLKAFIAVAETQSFSKAAQIIGRSQSAVSLQIKRLEDALKTPLFIRTSRSVALSENGEIFLGYARRMIDLQREAFSRITEPDIQGEITLGVPEDFATHYLPEILSAFAQQHPHVQLHVVCDLTLNLLKQYKNEQLDIAILKRDPEKVTGGTNVWREPLVWAAAEHYQPKSTLQLVLSPQPCIYRARAIAALDHAHINWQISYSSPSLAGNIAAVRGGLGITVLPANMIPTGIIAIDHKFELPKLEDSQLALMKKDSLSPAGNAFVNHIISSLEKPIKLNTK